VLSVMVEVSGCAIMSNAFCLEQIESSSHWTKGRCDVCWRL